MRTHSLAYMVAITCTISGCSLLPTVQQYEKADPANNPPMSAMSASEVFVAKGVRYMEAGQYEVALHDLEKAVELDDDNSEAYNALGVLYQQLDNPKKADGSFKRSLSLKEDNYAAINNYGKFLCSVGRFPEAFAQFKKVIGTKLYTQPWIPLTNAAVCDRMAGRLQEAEVFLSQALETAPTFPPALLEMVRLNRERGKNKMAHEYLQRYFAVSPPNRESLRLGIEIETALGNSTLAESYSKALNGMTGGINSVTPLSTGQQRPTL